MLVAFVEYLFFHITIVITVAVNMKLLTGFIFERGRAHQFSDTGIHIQIKIQFCNFTHVALHIDSCLFRIYAASQIFG